MIPLVLLALTPPIQWQLPPEPPVAQPMTQKSGVLPSDELQALQYLTSPAGTPEPLPCEERWPFVRDAIHKKAVDLELMDPRETRYVLADRDEWQKDIDILRCRYETLKDAPTILDAKKLPDRRTVNDLIKFNREFKKHLEDRLLWEADRGDIIHATLKENEACYRAWDLARDAQCDFYYVTVRRLAMKKLRDLLPEQDKEIFHMPDYVPTWRFTRK